MKLILSCAFIIFFPSTLSMSEEFILCELKYDYYYGNSVWNIKSVTYICSEDVSQISFTNNGTGYLYCSNTKQTLSKAKVSTINFVNCKMPDIKYDYFEKYSNIRELNVSHTGLERLNKTTFKNAIQLQIFNASHNNIEEIPSLLFIHAENLMKVDFSHNKIKRFDNFALSGVKQLNSLNLSFNYIEKINGDYFDSAMKLTYLNLSNNAIDEIAPNTFLVLENLNSLDLSFNNIKKLNKSAFDGLVRLQSLTLQRLSNETTEIESTAFMGLNTLLSLNLSQNRIASVEMGTFKGLSHLKSIALSPIKIDRIMKFSFEFKLRELDISNDLSSFALLNCTTVIIDKDAFNNLTSLESLNLANNPLQSLSVGLFANLEQLQFLNLSNIKLSDIKLGTFSHTIKLKTLDLSRNLLKKFDFGLFLPRNNLNRLYLDGNNLIELEGFSSRILPDLLVVGLTGNDFNCTYLKAFISFAANINYTDPKHRMPLNPHETNVHKINCKMAESSDSVTVITKTSTTTMVILFKRLISHENLDMKMN